MLDVGYNEKVSNVVTDDADRILVVGTASDTAEPPTWPVVVRTTESGALDATYGTGGVVTGDETYVGPVAGTLDHQGRLLVAARSAVTDSKMAVFRMLGNGSIDPSFRSNLPHLDGPVTPGSISVGTNGRIVVAGHTAVGPPLSDFSSVVVRMLGDGALDRSLHGSGWVRPNMGTDPLHPKVAVDNDHRIVIAADHNHPAAFSSAVVRLLRNGLPDSSFGMDGLVSTELGPVNLGALAISSEGLLVAGSIHKTSLQDMFVARLELSPIPSVSFVDDSGSVFESHIEALARAGITLGCNPPANDRFCPNDPVTRGQMAAFLVRSFGYTDDGGGDLFVDDDESVFAGDIDRLGAAGVTLGCNPPVNDRFCPDNPVTREQMAAFLTRALDL
jgi:uncharacterized delta-60 repeat protein